MATRTTTRRPSAASRKATATQPNATPPVVTAPAVLNGVVVPAGTHKPATKHTGPRYAVVPADGGGFQVSDKGKALAKVFKTEAQAKAAIALITELAPVRTASAKSENVKQDARRALANHLVSAYAKAFADMADNDPIFVALGREAAAQFASNWVHHLPITAEAFGTNLPLPKRSNWADGNRK